MCTVSASLPKSTGRLCGLVPLVCLHGGGQHNHTGTKEMCKEKRACAVLAARRVLVLVANFDLIDEPFGDGLQATPSCRPREQGQQYWRTCWQGADRSPIALRLGLSLAISSEICWHTGSFPTGRVALLFVFLM